MKRVSALLLALGLGLSGCVSLLVNPGGLGCEEGSAARCEESELVLCVEGVELRQDCAPGVCLAELGACGGGPACGDGIQDAGEECDDGNTQNGDGCDAACLLEAGPDCGNGVQDAGEQCDDGNNSNTDACTNSCRDADCGDGFLQPVNGEQCDDANNSNTDACLNSCQNARCGDGVVRSGVEGCDDGNLANGDGCSAQCQVENQLCGNGVLNAGEQCDDGNTVSGDGCSSACTQEVNACSHDLCEEGAALVSGCDPCVTQVCAADSFCCNNTWDSACVSGAVSICGLSCNTAVCGNGLVEAGEACDDGNATPGNFINDTCDPNCTAPACGNGVVGFNNVGGFPFPEDCDDGNTTGGDGCDAFCFNENNTGCGNGVQDAGEGCDDGDTQNGDGCSSQCQIEAGGNCAAPFTAAIDTHAGDTAGRPNIADGSCQTSAGGGGGGDVIFRFTASASGTRTFSLSSIGDLGVFLQTACVGTELACADADVGAANNPESEIINISLSANQTVFVFVGAFRNNTNAPFTLTIQ